MSQYPSKKTIITGIDLDTDETRLADDKAKFVKGLTLYGGRNPNVQNVEGDNAGVWIPQSGNILIGNPILPVGDNFCIGAFYSKETSELYCFVYNSLSNHLIYRVNADGSTQIVYKNPCLNFQYDEKHYITTGRCVLRVQSYIAYDGSTQKRKFLIFTDNYNDQRCISVEDSINTNSFSTSFFKKNGYQCDPSYFINLGVAHSMRCIDVQQIARTDQEKSKQNLTVNKGWQFRLKFIDVFGRVSEHGIISNRYYTIIGSNCIQTNNSLPRCYSLTLDAGCAMVSKIQLEFRTNSSENWFLYDTINKYNECQDKPWYLMDINPNINYDPTTNTITYTFCGDKECQPIDEAETSRLFNPLPLQSSGLMPINRGIALSNNIRGFEPLDCDELNKIDYSVIAPPEGCETSVLRTITIYVPIYNPLTTGITALWEYDIDNATVFWGMGTTGKNPSYYGQYFVPGSYGFPGYLAGTKYFSQSTQVYIDMTTKQETALGILKYPTSQPIGPSDSLSTNSRVYQKFQFKVPPGEYSFRIGSHLSLQSENYQRTSTNVHGKVKMNKAQTVVNDDKELIINCCNGDVILLDDNDETLVIWDCSFGPYTCGYVKEAADTDIPVEYIPVSDLTGYGAYYSEHTDFNGFYFGAGTGRYISLMLNADVCVTTVHLMTPYVQDLFGINHYALYKGDASGDPYPAAGRRTIKGRVEICGTDIGVGGALAVMKGAQFANTNSQGDFTLIAHQRPNDWDRDLVILSQSGSCRIAQCDDPCAFCFPERPIVYIPCGAPDRTTTLDTWDVNIIGNDKGLENGSRRGIGIVMHDWMGRCGNVQILDKHYVDIPSIIDTRKFKFSTVTWAMNNSITFPSWVKYVTFWVTDNLDYAKSLMWVADSISYVDNGGNVNNVAPTKVRVYYESLLEYNKQNNYGTNTTWEIQTVDASGNTSSVVGDYVQFIKNGDGTWFNDAVTSLITYDKDGKYFDLEYTDQLSGLLSGALIKLIRPKQCETEQLFYETCSTIRVYDGKPEAYSGIINAYDSYFINRQIPIPQEQKDSSGNVVRTVVAQYFSFFFEHNSPSDFWGNNLANKGRINVKNPYERKLFNISETALSKALVDKSNFFGLSYYDINDVATFEEQEWGAMVVGIVENNIVLFICEHNNFLVSFNDDIVRVGITGQVIAGSTADKFGKPQRKIGSDYGCQFADINTIQSYNGKVWYVDRNKNALLMHNFSEAIDVSKLGYKSYLTKKIATINDYNTQEGADYRYIMIGGINPDTSMYYLTMHGRKIAESQVLYTNMEYDHSIQIRETIEVDMTDGMLISFPMFVPEIYGYMDGYKNGKTMFTYKEGKAWCHKIIDRTTPFNNYFGVQGKKILIIVTNLDSEKVKRFMYNEVYNKQHKMIIDYATTESGQQSRILSPYWKFAEKFWAAPFLRNVNTFVDPNKPQLLISTLTEGDALTGRWLRTRYISEDAYDGVYCEMGGIIAYVIPVEKSGG